MSLSILYLAGALAAAPGGPRPMSDATPYCAAIARHVDAEGGDAPVFLRSYEAGPTETTLPPPLATSAFSYDNALAIIALVACGDVSRARRIADAFVVAIANDRGFRDGRIRNAYRAGPVATGSTKLPGWWDAKQNLWAEDAYQDGTQTGNVAWVALALLAIDDAAPSSSYRGSAETLARWIETHAADTRPPGGFSGGEAGYDPNQLRLEWRSTEHNVDVAALGARLAASNPNGIGSKLVASARGFLDAMFDPAAGFFRLGTKPDGAVQPASHVALDALIWPIVGVSDTPKAWRRSLAFAKSHLGVPGGFDFDGDRDGLWTEGTAQAAFVESVLGDTTSAARLKTTLAGLAAPSGYLYATGSGRITTGIAIGPDSKSDDFYYFHRPHLGATAWAVLAETGFNPFIGRKGL